MRARNIVRAWRAIKCGGWLLKLIVRHRSERQCHDQDARSQPYRAFRFGPGALAALLPLAFERRPASAGTAGGIIHFGFRLTKPEDIDAAIAAVEAAGGTLSSQGSFGVGLPYAFVRDPDGYEIEIWFEPAVFDA
jgi:catechol 2,3-dioxygenase-like lactoylglutathione lyase family enzyme